MNLLSKKIGHYLKGLLVCFFLSGKMVHGQSLFSGANGASSMVVTKDNNLYIWGRGNSGQLGLSDCPTPAASINPPILHPFQTFKNNVKAYAIGETYSGVITLDGKLFVFGVNRSGQLGNTVNAGNFTPNCIPFQVPLPTGAWRWEQIANGERYHALIADNGQIYVWGSNMYGQQANTTNLGLSNNPPNPTVDGIANPDGVSRWKYIGGGYNHILAISQNDKLYSWGDNYTGQLGNGKAVATPDGLIYEVQIPSGASGWTKATGGGGTPNNSQSADPVKTDFSLGIANNGKLYAWGGNDAGQLGDATKSPSYLPKEIPFPQGVTFWTEIACGKQHAAAIGNNGKLYTWGANGNTTILGRTGGALPAEVSFPNGVTAWLDVAAGLQHTLIIGNDNNLYAFGGNTSGALGLSSAASVPTKISSITLAQTITNNFIEKEEGDYEAFFNAENNCIQIFSPEKEIDVSIYNTMGHVVYSGTYSKMVPVQGLGLYQIIFHVLGRDIRKRVNVEISK